MSNVVELGESVVMSKGTYEDVNNAFGKALNIISGLEDDYDSLEKDYLDLDERHRKLHKAIAMFMIKHGHCQELINEIENQYKINETDEY